MLRFLINSGSVINITNLETFNRKKKKGNWNLFLKPTKSKILTHGAINVSSLQRKDICQLNIERGKKDTTALLYVIDLNSHNLFIGACVIELPRTSSEKRDKRNKLQEVSVVKVKNCKGK